MKGLPVINRALLLAPCAALMLSGCLAKTVLDTAVGAASLPVKVASRGFDLATTSQAEADRNRGRELRRREERLGALEREHRALAARCDDGSEDACRRAETVSADIAELLPTVPLERD